MTADRQERELRCWQLVGPLAERLLAHAMAGDLAGAVRIAGVVDELAGAVGTTQTLLWLADRTIAAQPAGRPGQVPVRAWPVQVDAAGVVRAVDGPLGAGEQWAIRWITARACRDRAAAAALIAECDDTADVRYRVGHLIAVAASTIRRLHWAGRDE